MFSGSVLNEWTGFVGAGQGGGLSGRGVYFGDLGRGKGCIGHHCVDEFI